MSDQAILSTSHSATPNDTARAGSPGLGTALGAEWRKFWALPVTRTVLAATIAVTVGLSVLIVLFGGGDNLAQVQRDEKYDAIFFSAIFGVWAVIYLGANFVASEFRTGMADYTFVAIPRRSRVLLAKILILGGLGLVLGALISVVDVALTQGALALAGLPTLRLDDPAMVRPILLYIGVGMCFQGILGSLLAVLVRNAFGAVALTILLSLLPILFAKFFGPGYTHSVPRWTPGAIVESLSGVAKVGSDGYLPTWLALVGAIAWTALFLAGALIRLVRADAR